MGAVFAAARLRRRRRRRGRGWRYDEAMARFGVDRPDTRFGLEIARRGRGAARLGVQGLRAARWRAAASCAAINAGARELSRTELDELTELAKRHGAKGLVWAFVAGGRRLALADREVPLRATSVAGGRRERSARQPGDLLLIVADTPKVAAPSLGALRLELARALRAGRPRARHDILWIVDFPMFEQRRGRGRWDGAAPPVHGARGRPRRRPGRAALARLRPRARRLRDRRRLDPHPPHRRAAARARAARHRAPRRRTRASASCSTRCATARRRTAASRWASTASSRCSPAASRSAT